MLLSIVSDLRVGGQEPTTTSAARASRRFGQLHELEDESPPFGMLIDAADR